MIGNNCVIRRKNNEKPELLIDFTDRVRVKSGLAFEFSNIKMGHEKTENSHSQQYHQQSPHHKANQFISLESEICAIVGAHSRGFGADMAPLVPPPVFVFFIAADSHAKQCSGVAFGL